MNAPATRTDPIAALKGLVALIDRWGYDDDKTNPEVATARAAIADAVQFRIKWDTGSYSAENVVTCSAADRDDVIDILDIALPDNCNGTFEAIKGGA